eukprot:1731249-Pyramimonas_sp.AAC.1
MLVSVLWWRRTHDNVDLALSAVRTGEVRLWSAFGQPLCAVQVEGLLSSAALVPGARVVTAPAICYIIC